MISPDVRSQVSLANYQQVPRLSRAALCRKPTPSPARSCTLVNLACANPFLPRSDINSSVASRQFSLSHRHTNPICAPCLRCSSKPSDQRRTSTSCPICSGSTQVPCDACKGSGRLTKSGYHAKNPVNGAKIVGSKWTALQRTVGWRHFRATQKMKAGKQTYALMMATCDNSACMWINMQNLKDRDRWASGWLQRSEVEAMNDLGATCQVCAGTGHMICPLCRDGPVVIL
ncbi:TPA: hypothetical protein ACH3X1_005848 [Trebouxia sp. C0004]